MRIVNEYFKTIDESEVDLTKGQLVKSIGIREDATPVDDITKFAWYDEDYEEVQMYVLNKESEETQPSQTDELTLVIDALLGIGGVQNG